MQPVWDPNAEKLHRISFEQLLTLGRPPFEVARPMNEVLPGRELFSDGPADDERSKPGWGSASYEAAKAERTIFPRERIVLKRMLVSGLCFGV